VVGSQLVPLPPKSAGSYVPFSVDIVYTISSYISALLQVSQMDERIGGMMYLYSQEVYLNP
jgi:glutaredoxin 2